MDISRPICMYYIFSQKTNKEFGNVMCLLWGDNDEKCSLTIMDVGTIQSAKKPLKILGTWCEYFQVVMLQNVV
jgi:hypothetical protein